MNFLKRALFPIYQWYQTRFPDARRDLAVLSIMKNEEWNVAEWIDHYFWQGVDHLFIIDNGSDDRTVDLIKSHQRVKSITIIDLPEPHKQCAHYWTAFKRCQIRKKFRWLAVADGDEFWYARKDSTLAEAIERFDEKFDVIYSRWANFGCPEQDIHPISLRTALLHRSPGLAPHTAKKWIVRTDIVKKGSFMTHKIVGGCSSRTTVDHDFFQLNHYVTRSREYWTKTKMTRGSVSRAKNVANWTLEKFEEVNRMSTFKDEELAQLVSRPKQDKQTVNYG